MVYTLISKIIFDCNLCECLMLMLMLLLTCDFTGNTALKYHHNRFLALNDGDKPCEFTSPKQGSSNAIQEVLV